MTTPTTDGLPATLLGRCLCFLPPDSQATWLRCDDGVAFSVSRWLLLDVFAAIRNRDLPHGAPGRFLAFAPPGHIYAHEDRVTGLPHGASDRLIRILDRVAKQRLATITAALGKNARVAATTAETVALFNHEEWAGLFDRTFGDDWLVTLWPARYGPAGAWVSTLLNLQQRAGEMNDDKDAASTSAPSPLGVTTFGEVFSTEVTVPSTIDLIQLSRLRSMDGPSAVIYRKGVEPLLQRQLLSDMMACITASPQAGGECRHVVCLGGLQTPPPQKVVVLGVSSGGVAVVEHVELGLDRYGLYYTDYNALSALPLQSIQQLHVAGGMTLGAICFSVPAWPALEVIDMTSCWFTRALAAFANCPALKLVLFPPLLEVIESISFNHCTALVEVDLRALAALYKVSGFQHCTALKRVWLPGSLTTLSGAFSDCASLVEVHFAAAGDASSSRPLELVWGAFNRCVSLVSVTLPNSLTRCDGFRYCAKLESVDMRACVRLATVSGFSDNPSLHTIRWPPSLAQIGHDAFARCLGLRVVDLTNCEALSSVGGFSSCERLEEVRFPFPQQLNHVSFLWDAFSGCHALTYTNLHFEANKEWRQGAPRFQNCPALRPAPPPHQQQ